MEEAKFAIHDTCEKRNENNVVLLPFYQTYEYFSPVYAIA